MKEMFINSQFNSDIGEWNTLRVENMSSMFTASQFNRSINQWCVARVTDMAEMFAASQFDKDISGWDVSNVERMSYMFCDSQFKGDISEWNIVSLMYINDIFLFCKAPVPYWAKIDNMQERQNAMQTYNCKKALDISLSTNNKTSKVLKI